MFLFLFLASSLNNTEKCLSSINSILNDKKRFSDLSIISKRHRDLCYQKIGKKRNTCEQVIEKQLWILSDNNKSSIELCNEYE